MPTQTAAYLQFTKKLTNGANSQSLILKHSVGQSNVRLLHKLVDIWLIVIMSYC